MSKYFIGIMTGTSADALDGCIVSFEKEFSLKGSHTIDLGKSYKKKYEKCIRNGHKITKDSNDLLKIENELTKKTVHLINKLLRNTNMSSKDIHAIGFSGQTIFHTVKKSYQVGNPQKISDNLNIDVISDFRNFDISKGGMGAPLIPEFHKYIYSEDDKKKLIINIGGISNGTYLDGNKIGAASDIGPGNCLIDFVANKYFNKPYDENGYESSKGNIDMKFLNLLIGKTSKMIYPRSDDKNDYYVLLNEIDKKIMPNDLLRTLTEFTAEKIKEFYLFCNKPDEVIFHGGGTKNNFLMSTINNKINVDVKTTDGEIPSQYAEAAAFAYLAFLKKGKLFN